VAKELTSVENPFLTDLNTKKKKTVIERVREKVRESPKRHKEFKRSAIGLPPLWDEKRKGGAKIGVV